jgi:hypothetical protein
VLTCILWRGLSGIAEYFIPPDEEVWEGFHQQWIETSWQWLKSIGLREDLMAKVHLIITI